MSAKPKMSLIIALGVRDKHRKMSKGGKAEKSRIYGESGEPNPSGKSKEHHAKQVEALSRLAEKRYGLPLSESGGKFYPHDRINKERKAVGHAPLSKEELESHPGYEKSSPESVSHGNTLYRSKEQKSNPKPDWHSNKLESQRHIGAKVHEMGHLDISEHHKKLGDFQEHMDEGSKRAGKIKSKEGEPRPGAAKQIQEEIQPMAMENPLRRRAGIPAHGRAQAMSSIYGESSKKPLEWHHPPRTSLDTHKEYATRLPNKEGKPVDLIAQAKNLSPENKQRLHDVDAGITKFHKSRGMYESKSPNALINLRGQGRHEEATERLKNRGEDRMAHGGSVADKILRKKRGY